MLVLPGFTLLLLTTHTSYITTALSSPEATILDHISELLNPDECHELYIRITIPQKDAKGPSLEEKDPSSQWQEISSTAQCKESLNHWLQMERGTVDWDRLARGLRQIGRPDVSRELKKKLNKNRSLEPKWNVEDNHIVETVKSDLFILKEAPNKKWQTSPVQNRKRVLPKESGWEPSTFFKHLFGVPGYKLSLQECIGPATRIILASFLTGMVLWLVSIYYVVCWNLGQCLFTNGIRHNASARQNVHFTMIWNDQPSEDSSDEGQEQLSISEDEEATEDEC